ncbi:MAG: hypothetical protein JXC85_04230 [Candidatus Aenigmarchaeota archaeon]|nr:hypothetical protein [Candidatus Aenigmarchaeota archaeon]
MSKRGRRSREVVTDVPAAEPEGQAEQAGTRAKSSSPGILSNRKLLYAVVLIVVVAIAAWRICTMALPDSTTGLTGQVVSSGGATLGAQEAGVKLVDFLQSRLEISYPGIEVTLVDARDFAEIPGTYEVSVDISLQGETQTIPYYVTRDGSFMFANIVDLNEEMPVTAADAGDGGDVGANAPANPEILTFIDSGEPVCTVDGKPVVYLFSTTWCGHCGWIKDTFDSTVKEYVDAGKIVAYHYQIDTGDDTLTEEVETSVPDSDMAVYSRFNPRGSIPTFVFGCKYYRVGNGFESQQDLAAEEAEFRKVIDDLLSQ